MPHAMGSGRVNDAMRWDGRTIASTWKGRSGGGPEKTPLKAKSSSRSAHVSMKNTRREQMVMAEPTAATRRRFIPRSPAFHSSSRPITRCSLNRRLLQTRLTRLLCLPPRPLLPLLPSTWSTTSSLLASLPRDATNTTTATAAGITATTAITETTAAAAAAAGTRTVTGAAERTMERKSLRTSAC